MRGEDGLTFADVLILIALILLLAALAIPFFRRNPELSEAEIFGEAATNTTAVTPPASGR